MKLKYEFIFQHIGDQWMGVPVGEDAANYNNMLQLNDVGHEIVEMMHSDVEREDIISMLLSKYEADYSEVASSVDEIIALLNSFDLIV